MAGGESAGGKEGGVSMDEEELWSRVRQVAERAYNWAYTGERQQENMKIFLLAAMVLKLDEVGYELAALDAKVGRLVDEEERGGECTGI